MSLPLFKTKKEALSNLKILLQYTGVYPKKEISKRKHYLIKLLLPTGSGFIQSQGAKGIFYTVLWLKNRKDVYNISGGKISKIISVKKLD